MASQRKSAARVYRLVRSKYPPFDGTGAHRWGSRWVSPGRWVVHTAETYALAVLDNLVHWQSNVLPPTLVYITIEIPGGMTQERVVNDVMPPEKGSDYHAFRAIRDDWYDRAETAVLWVPSVVSPHEANIQFNQHHRDFGRLTVSESRPAHLDSRLLS